MTFRPLGFLRIEIDTFAVIKSHARRYRLAIEPRGDRDAANYAQFRAVMSILGGAARTLSIGRILDPDWHDNR